MVRAVLSLLLVLAAAAVRGQQPAPRPPEGDPTVEEIQTIRKILELPPERLQRMRSAIEKIERMSPESRREFAASLVRYESATPEERHRLMKEMRERGGFGARALEHHFKRLSPEEAKAERARLQALTPEQRLEFIRRLAEKYGPEIAKERGKGGEPKDGPGGAPKRRKPPEGEIPGGAPKQ
jgi:Spy/CpxP family protein refolding chaperone